jgi:hypothetical protein
MTNAEITVRTVTNETWPDFARLFEARGSPHYCWCMVYRSGANRTMSKEERREAMHGVVARGTPVGLLAYDGDEPVAWCSVAPRETYERLERSKTMPRVSDAPTWTVLCFFVKRSHRGLKLTPKLLLGAADYAGREGGEVIEGYPWDTSNNKSRHRGYSSAFRAAGFRREGNRWFRALSDGGR